MKVLIESWKRYSGLNEAINPKTIEKIQTSLRAAGGESYIVGGAVRDSLIPGIPESKDVDFVVTGLEFPEIVDALSELGEVSEAGAHFGVVIARIDGEDFDLAIPRVAETKTGSKHTDFEVETDPNASVEADLGRRDFTINAMAKDVSGNIIDVYGGQEDIKAGVIRAVGDAYARFSEDPLRMLRAIQFATRFGFIIEPDTAKAIRTLKGKLATIAPERILMEFHKALTKGKRDTQTFVKLLHDLGLGQELFGSGFKPVAISLSGTPDELINGNFVALFLQGGEFANMKPTNEMKSFLEMAQALAFEDKQVWEVVGQNGPKLPLLLNVFKSMGVPAAKELERVLTLNLPLSTKQLAIGGRELMSLGLKGPDIGHAQKALMRAIYNGEIGNTPEEVEEYLR